MGFAALIVSFVVLFFNCLLLFSFPFLCLSTFFFKIVVCMMMEDDETGDSTVRYNIQQSNPYLLAMK